MWVVLYGVPVGFAWLYEKYLVRRGGFWIALGVPVFLLLGAACGFIGYSVRYEFVVAPFIGYALAGGMVIKAMLLGIKVCRKDLDNPRKSQYVAPANKVEELKDDAKNIVVTGLASSLAETSTALSSVIIWESSI